MEKCAEEMTVTPGLRKSEAQSATPRNGTTAAPAFAGPRRFAPSPPAAKLSRDLARDCGARDFAARRFFLSGWEAARPAGPRA